MHHEIIPELERKIEDSLQKDGIIDRLKKNLDLEEFHSDFSKDIGFMGLFQKICEDGEFEQFMVKVPEKNNKIYETISFADVMVNISATWTVLTSLLAYTETRTNCPRPQLLTILTDTKRFMRGGKITGEISIAMSQWLESLGDTLIPEMANAMKEIERHRAGTDKYDYFIRAYTKEGGLYVQGEGNTYGLITIDDPHKSPEKEGIKISSRDCDLAYQQFTLLAALAAACDRARKEIQETTL